MSLLFGPLRRTMRELRIAVVMTHEVFLLGKMTRPSRPADASLCRTVPFAGLLVDWGDGPHRSPPPAPRRLPPKLRAYLQNLGFDLAAPVLTAAVLDGVQVAEDASTAEERWMQAQCNPERPARR